MAKKSQHVVPSAEGGWAVRRVGAGRASKIFDTQKEATTYASTRAKSEKGEVYIHGRNGQIRSRNTYGKDPCPPRDKL